MQTSMKQYKLAVVALLALIAIVLHYLGLDSGGFLQVPLMVLLGLAVFWSFGSNIIWALKRPTFYIVAVVVAGMIFTLSQTKYDILEETVTKLEQVAINSGLAKMNYMGRIHDSIIKGSSSNSNNEVLTKTDKAIYSAPVAYTIMAGISMFIFIPFLMV